MKVSELRIDPDSIFSLTWEGTPTRSSPIVSGKFDVAYGSYHAVMSIDTFNSLRDLAAQAESAAAQRTADLKRINELEEKMAGVCPTYDCVTAKGWYTAWVSADSERGQLKDRVRELESQLREAQPQPLVNGGNAAYWYQAQQRALLGWDNETSKLKGRITELESQLREARQSQPTPPPTHLGKDAFGWYEAWRRGYMYELSVELDNRRLRERITELEGSIADAKTALNSSESGNS